MVQEPTIQNSSGMFVRSIRRVTSFGFNQSLRELLGTIVVRFLVLGFNFGATTLITRSLSVEDRGKYGYMFNLIYLLMTSLCFGFHSSIVYILSQKRLYFAYLYTIAFIMALGSFVVLTFLALSGLLQHLCPLFNSFDVAIIVVAVPIVLFYYFNSYFFISINDFKHYNLYEFLKNLSFMLLTLITFKIVLPYQYFMIFFIISNIVYVLASFKQFSKLGYIKTNLSFVRNNWKKFVVIFKRSVNMASISYFSCILSFLLSKYVLFFIGTFLVIGIEQKQALGYYAVALANADISIVFPCTLAFYIFPKISAVQDLQDKISIVSKVILLCLLYFVSIGIFSYLFLDALFSLFYGPAYLASVPMFELLLPSALFLSIISCISSFIGGIGMDRTAIYAPLCALIFMIGGSIILMQSSFNVYNFIIVQNFAYFIYLIIYARFFLKKWKESKNV
ncbi:MAG: hypothetical protein M3R00_02945 [Pseudomonadota bacterium]|nr:hypothetical protein [Pseudomonadota bacterium]